MKSAIKIARYYISLENQGSLCCKWVAADGDVQVPKSFWCCELIFSGHCSSDDAPSLIQSEYVVDETQTILI